MTMVAALSTTLTVGASTPAQAAGNCPTGLTWHRIDPNQRQWVAWQYAINSVKSEFLVSEERVVSNGTDREITGSFTSSVSKTFSLTYSAGSSASLFGFLSANVSASITQSTTTTTGVTATAPVPPHGRVIGQYGVEAYNVDVTKNEYRSIHAPPEEGGICYPARSTPGTSIAPTNRTGWRVIPG
ncbi:hypothetical protein [Streptomyces chrestomyceticus]|uniref:Uncharacterized protein n=1 Tax=Streptomyces chrestomyceticus TaxID=68185 RepID=A0ABU7X6U7_9ACTN